MSGQGGAGQGADGRHRDPEELTDGTDEERERRGGCRRKRQREPGIELTLHPGPVPAGRCPVPVAAQPGRLPLPASVLRPLPRVPRRPRLLVDLAQLQQGRPARLGEVRRPRRTGGRSPTTSELTDSIKNTAIYVVEAIFLVFTLALFLALLLNRYRKGSNIFKLALYVPLLAPAVLVGLDLAVRDELRLRPLQPDPHEPRARPGEHLRQTATLPRCS